MIKIAIVIHIAGADMLALVQRVSSAEVKVNDIIVGSIKLGILAFIGLEKMDTEKLCLKLIEKILQFRIFSDQEGKMNLSLKDIQGGLLLVPQFTLAADTQKGNRPGFSTAMNPSEGETLFARLIETAKSTYSFVEVGKFGAYMQVLLCNDGPATFLLKIS